MAFLLVPLTYLLGAIPFERLSVKVFQGRDVVFLSFRVGKGVAACALCLLLYFFLAHHHPSSLSSFLAVSFWAGLVLCRHQEDIRRLLAGTESRLTGQKP